MEYPANYNVKLAAHLFEKNASFWQDIGKPKEDGLPAIWAYFKGVVDEKYYPKQVKWANDQEFLNIEQGKMSIIEYMAKFNELSGFALHQVVKRR